MKWPEVQKNVKIIQISLAPKVKNFALISLSLFPFFFISLAARITFAIRPQKWGVKNRGKHHKQNKKRYKMKIRVAFELLAGN